MIDVEGPLFFASGFHMRNLLSRLGDYRCVVLDLDGVPFLDVTGTEILDEEVDVLHRRGIEVLIARPTEAVRNGWQHWSSRNSRRSPAARSSTPSTPPCGTPRWWPRRRGPAHAASRRAVAWCSARRPGCPPSPTCRPTRSRRPEATTRQRRNITPPAARSGRGRRRLSKWVPASVSAMLGLCASALVIWGASGSRGRS